jgi:hypothetical protein
MPSELAGVLLRSTDSPALAEAFASGLHQVVSAVLDGFPGNLLWDFDHLGAQMLAQARRASDPARALSQIASDVAALQTRFGVGTPINFRYAHDFVYGFDWAKWVAKAPAERASVGPFDPGFLGHMRRRGDELLELIDHGDDPKYPPLSSNRPRNPFKFSREPAAEITLHRTLAARGWLPIEAWRVDATPRWGQPFAELRRAAAVELELALPPSRPLA